eukprot:gnl/TRDRNA2_/TRDRNA2_167805_c0_seq1.p1 gnl/TRDRNA2_/TRDRNA2_167805_c0~~gnl/TRDRNA2_/TRDRNA2_167805_c0_seq1.p1  ORF type:complete len:105 (+),score=13.37 gnl/TRDRNA2_/TRDRNA2_167805_c0_seq1:46-360(+)
MFRRCVLGGVLTLGVVGFIGLRIIWTDYREPADAQKSARSPRMGGQEATRAAAEEAQKSAKSNAGKKMDGRSRCAPGSSWPRRRCGYGAKAYYSCCRSTGNRLE